MSEKKRKKNREKRREKRKKKEREKKNEFTFCFVNDTITHYTIVFVRLFFFKKTLSKLELFTNTWAFIIWGSILLCIFNLKT